MTNNNTSKATIIVYLVYKANKNTMIKLLFLKYRYA